MDLESSKPAIVRHLSPSERGGAGVGQRWRKEFFGLLKKLKCFIVKFATNVPHYKNVYFTLGFYFHFCGCEELL